MTFKVKLEINMPDCYIAIQEFYIFINDINNFVFALFTKGSICLHNKKHQTFTSKLHFQ